MSIVWYVFLAQPMPEMWSEDMNAEVPHAERRAVQEGRGYTLCPSCEDKQAKLIQCNSSWMVELSHPSHIPNPVVWLTWHCLACCVLWVMGVLWASAIADYDPGPEVGEDEVSAHMRWLQLLYGLCVACEAHVQQVSDSIIH